MTSFKSWLSDMLEKLEVDSDMYTEYIVGIMEQEDNTIEENARTTTEFLAAIADISESYAKTLIEKLASQTTESSSSNSTTDQEEEDMVSRTIREARELLQRQKMEALKRERKRLVEDLGLGIFICFGIFCRQGRCRRRRKIRTDEVEENVEKKRRRKKQKPRKRETR